MSRDEPLIDFVTFIEYSWVKEQRTRVSHIVPEGLVLFTLIGWIVVFVFLAKVATRRKAVKPVS